MAWFEAVLGGWGSTALVGLSVVLAAPPVLPVVGAVVWPVAKVTIKGGCLWWTLSNTAWPRGLSTSVMW